MYKTRLSVKLNLLAISIILAVALAVSAAGVITINRLTSSLSERLMRSEITQIINKLDEAHKVLKDTGVEGVETYIQRTQAELLTELKHYQFGATGRLYISSGDGQVVLVADDRQVTDVRLLKMAQDPVALSGANEGVVAGQPSVAYFSRFMPWDWHVMLTMSKGEINAQRGEFLSMVSIILVASVLLGVIIFAWFASRFVKPILELSKQMSALTEDSLGDQLDINDSSSEVAQLHHSFRDMTKRLHEASLEKRKAEEMIWRQANFDPLTDLPNRRMFFDRLGQALKIAERSGRMVALMFLDLDNFKDVNDTLGHDHGDLLLVEAARRLRTCVRQTDTLARLGGDEFTVTLTEVDDINAAERVAQEILNELAEPFQLGNNIAYVSASIGITLFPQDAKDQEILVAYADQAMFTAKKRGRNCFQYFTPTLQEAAQTRSRTIYDLRNALPNDEFVLHYQPIIDLKTNTVCKAEALVRWNHPQRGLVSPIEFIGVAEETGLISALGDWIFRTSANQVLRWRIAYGTDFQVSVNTSPAQYQEKNSHLTTDWINYLNSLGLPGGAVVTEITEGMLMSADSGVIDKLLSFRDSGIQVALDDFGTGYCSLSYLRKFDIDFLKIDRTFVSQLEVSENDRALCEAIIVMAHKLKIQVIAEGVETSEQRDILKSYGCDYGQGYLFSKPLPADEFDRYLASVRRA